MPSQLATLPEHPESVPINALVAVAGTPLEGREPVSALELARVIATSRLTMPRSVVRLSAGRLNFSVADQVTPPGRHRLCRAVCWRACSICSRILREVAASATSLEASRVRRPDASAAVNVVPSPSSGR